MDHRTRMTGPERKLFKRLQETKWSRPELEWVLGHLAPDHPLTLAAAIHYKLLAMPMDPEA